MAPELSQIDFRKFDNGREEMRHFGKTVTERWRGRKTESRFILRDRGVDGNSGGHFDGQKKRLKDVQLKLNT